ncbi:hypothetical protein G3M48_001450 [Beauveria asiatica]|uniref:BTB domain-containing protein n=1 Tax=Beauveria asiatica TaxID=1069075 RepID=A0AAW0S165_9HYPO
MPSPSRTEKKNVYSDSTLRRLFRQPRFAHLRQAKPVRLAIRQHHLSVWPYQEVRLVQIVRELLQDCVFESDYIAQRHFPELFKSSRPQLPSVREPIDESSTVSSIHLSYVPPDLQISMRENILVQRAGLFASGKYSDLLIIGGKYYHAHKNIVFCYSAVLETACRFSQKTALRSVLHDTTKGQAGSSDHCLADVTSQSLRWTDSDLDLTTARDLDTIDLQGENPIAVDCMMQFFYHTNYDTQVHSMNDPTDGSTQNHLHIHSLVYKLAEVYAVDELKALALAKFTKALSSGIDAPDFAAAAGEAYAYMVESLDGLRQAVIKGLHQHRKAAVQTEAVKALLHSNGIIGYDLALYETENNVFL